MSMNAGHVRGNVHEQIKIRGRKKDSKLPVLFVWSNGYVPGQPRVRPGFVIQGRQGIYRPPTETKMGT